MAVELGSKQLGYCVVALDPGRASCPYHFHHSEEELFHVLSGVGVLRQGDSEGEEEVELRAGDFVSFPAGTGIAHQFLNRSSAPFVYLAVSNRVAADVCEYPDSDKLLVRKTGTLVRRGPKLGYFDGELGER
ncbi:MAG: cupin domain-containing protein [Planctomycetota bacterium]|nr:cupin domain-containing protein [Planctomycetota bacterium]